jgi:hypothetical protein
MICPPLWINVSFWRSAATSDLPAILLQKSFWGDGRKFLEPLMRFARGDVRDHIDPSEIDHGVAALNSEAAAEKSKNQLSRDF